MAKKLIKPDVSEIEQFRFEATDGGKVSEEDWVKENCRIVHKIVARDPKRYRAYGPYWWIVKRALIANGYDDFGDHVDAEWVEQCDYGKDFYNLIAAWMYQERALDFGLIYSNAHTVEFEPEEDGMERDVGEYVLTDDEMELLGLEKGTQGRG